jgi:hypothetical protein
MAVSKPRPWLGKWGPLHDRKAKAMGLELLGHVLSLARLLR